MNLKIPARRCELVVFQKPRQIKSPPTQLSGDFFKKQYYCLPEPINVTKPVVL